jgi:hypothetical protein
MSTAEWLVVFAGAAAICWVNWYFFLASRGSRSGPGDPRMADQGPRRESR